jgi:hypothetical protein
MSSPTFLLNMENVCLTCDFSLPLLGFCEQCPVSGKQDSEGNTKTEEEKFLLLLIIEKKINFLSIFVLNCMLISRIIMIQKR